MGALSAVGVLPAPPPPGVLQRLGMHEAGGLSAVGPMRGRSGCLLPCLWGAPWDTRGDDPGPLPPGARRPPLQAHVPPVGAAVEAFFVHRDLAPNSRRVYRAALDPLVEAVGADQPLAALTPDSRGWGVHRAVGWCGGGDVEHSAGGGAGVRVLVRGPLAARRGSARFGGSPPPAHRPHPCGPLPGS